jgi:hypothetical protein
VKLRGREWEDEEMEAHLEKSVNNKIHFSISQNFLLMLRNNGF